MHNGEYWTSYMVKIMLAKSIWIEKLYGMPKMTTVTIVCLRLFIPLGEKNCHVEIYGRCEKKQCFRIEGLKTNFFFLILEMEGRRIRNQKI
jgi:hypothetical protein